jgi:preprotein translocase subunit YajC
MLFINKAFATEAGADMAAAASTAGPFGAAASQFLLIMVLVGLFYILLIAPQKKRFKEHKEMLDGLKKGDKVVTAGGLVGKIEKLDSDEEITINLGDVKVKAMRSTIHQKVTKDSPVKEAKEKAAKEKTDTK